MHALIVRVLASVANRPLYPLACATMLLVLTGINFYVVAVLAEQSDWVYHTSEVLIEVNNLEHYAAANDLDHATEAYSALRRLTADNPVQQHNLDQFDSQMTCSHDRTVTIMPAITHAMFAEETRLRMERIARARRTTRVLSLLSTVAVLAGVIMLLFSFFSLTSQISRRRSPHTQGLSQP